MERYSLRHRDTQGKAWCGLSGPRPTGTAGLYVDHPPFMPPPDPHGPKRLAYFTMVGQTKNTKSVAIMRTLLMKGVLVYLFFKDEGEADEYFTSLARLNRGLETAIVFYRASVIVENRASYVAWLQSCLAFRDRWTEPFVPFAIRQVWNKVEDALGVPLTIFDDTFDDLPVGNFSGRSGSVNSEFLPSAVPIIPRNVVVNGEDENMDGTRSLDFGPFARRQYHDVVLQKRQWCVEQVWITAAHSERKAFVDFLEHTDPSTDFGNPRSRLLLKIPPFGGRTYGDIAVNKKAWCKKQIKIVREQPKRQRFVDYIVWLAN